LIPGRLHLGRYGTDDFSASDERTCHLGGTSNPNLGRLQATRYDVAFLSERFPYLVTWGHLGFSNLAPWRTSHDEGSSNQAPWCAGCSASNEPGPMTSPPWRTWHHAAGYRTWPHDAGNRTWPHGAHGFCVGMWDSRASGRPSLV